MMYWSDCAMATSLAQFFIDLDPYGAGDAGLCDENDCTIPSEEYLFEVNIMAEENPEKLIEWLNDYAEYTDKTDERSGAIEMYLDWLNTMIEQKEV